MTDDKIMQFPSSASTGALGQPAQIQAMSLNHIGYADYTYNPSKAIIQAVLEVSAKVPSLVKGERNNFAKYNFVSIDTYYQEIAAIAFGCGLTWRIRQVATEMHPNLGKDGAMLIRYAVDVMHKDGDCAQNYQTVSIYHPLQGPQTAGSAMSYAEKLFMRTAFKVPTGEADADAVDPSDTRPRKSAALSGGSVSASGGGGSFAATIDLTKNNEAPEVPAKAEIKDVVASVDDSRPKLKDGTDWNGSHWQLASEVMIQFAPSCATKDDLLGFWQENIGALERMEKEAPEEHGRVKAAFAKLKKGLK